MWEELLASKHGAELSTGGLITLAALGTEMLLLGSWRQDLGNKFLIPELNFEVGLRSLVKINVKYTEFNVF